MSSRAVEMKPALYPFGFAFAIQKGIHFLLHSEYTRAQLQGRMFVASLLSLDWIELDSSSVAHTKNGPGLTEQPPLTSNAH